MINSDPTDGSAADRRRRRRRDRRARARRGAIALAGIATAIVVAMWFAFYLFVFLPRGVDPMSAEQPMATTAPVAEVAARVERRWATVIVVIIIVMLVAMAAFAGIHRATMPQARVETIEPEHAAHLRRVRREQSRQRASKPDGSVTVRAIGAAIFVHAAVHRSCRRTRRSLSAPRAPTSSTAS